MKIIHFDMDESRSVINAVRASIKQREDLEAVVQELVASAVMPQAVYLPNYDKETRWSSTFHMFNKAYNARKGFQMTAQRTIYRKKYYIAEHSWTKIKEVLDPLEVFVAAGKL